MYLNFKKSITEGDSSENNFEILLNKLELTFRKSTKNENIYKHFDYVVNSKRNKDKSYKIDVKSEKRKNRNNFIDSSIQWIEFMNVSGNKGWIFGESDYIAFENSNKFVIVERIVLLKYLIEEKGIIEDIYKKPIISNKNRIFYECYRREGRKDSIVMMPIQDIIDFCNPKIHNYID